MKLTPDKIDQYLYWIYRFLAILLTLNEYTLHTYTVAHRWHVYVFIYLVRTIIQSLLNIKGRSFIREEFCPAPESNMPLNNAKDTIVHCHFIKIGPMAGLSSLHSGVHSCKYNQWLCKPSLPLPVFNKFN